MNVGFSDDVQELFLFRANTRPMPKCQSGSSANRRRGTGLRSGWLPPILASCHALSFSTSAFRALLISSGFETSPVKFCACSRSSSSMLTVILIFPRSWLSPGRYNTHTGTYIKSVRKPTPRLPSAAFSGGAPGEASWKSCGSMPTRPGEGRDGQAARFSSRWKESGRPQTRKQSCLF